MKISDFKIFPADLPRVNDIVSMLKDENSKKFTIGKFYKKDLITAIKSKKQKVYILQLKEKIVGIFHAQLNPKNKKVHLANVYMNASPYNIALCRAILAGIESELAHEKYEEISINIVKNIDEAYISFVECAYFTIDDNVRHKKMMKLLHEKPIMQKPAIKRNIDNVMQMNELVRRKGDIIV
ncbi:MAG: hypothetical protein KGJ07_00225 [Patescibacteria group bacterium]|nr:hypothetical protein [Patescibacteria group bacterium]